MGGETVTKAPDKTLRWMIVILVAVVVLVGGYILYRWALANGVEKRLDAIRAQGYPVTLQELDDWYPTPPIGQNAADVYQQAFLKFSVTLKDENEKLPVLGMAKLPEPDEPLSSEMKQIVADYVKRNAEALKLLHEAAAYEQCRFPVGKNAGFTMILPHLAKIRQSARLLRLEATLAAEERDASAATKAVLSSLVAGRSLKSEPLLISHLVRIACTSISRISLERVLSRMPLDDAQLVDLEKAFRSAEDADAMTRAFVGERCFGIAFYKNPAAAAGAVGTGSALFTAMQLIGLMDMDMKQYIEVMNEHVAAVQAPALKQIEFADTTEERVKNLPKYCILSRQLLPALGRCVVEDIKNTAGLRVAATAMAVERLRLASGALPKALGDLVPKYLAKIPTDPFDGKPLRFKKLDKGYVVYSIGPNGKDDGGVYRSDKPSQWQILDITFTVKR